MDKEKMMGYEEALKLTLDTISPLDDHRDIDLAGCLGRVLFEDLYSRVDSPSIDASMKEGYAVRSHEISRAGTQNPVRLTVIGVSAAGTPAEMEVTPGTAVRVLTGGKIPGGADAVLAMTPTTLVRHRPDLVEGFFSDLADAAPLPVFLYSVPKVTAYELPLDVAIRLAAHGNVAGMKDSILEGLRTPPEQCAKELDW